MNGGAVLTLFERVFGHRAGHVSEAHGRVNLIGEYTDLNQGWVLPAVIPQRVRIAIAGTNRGTGQIRAYSTAFDEVVNRTVSDERFGHWSDYVVAGVRQIGMARRADIQVCIDSRIPYGKGLSSSAALLFALIDGCGRILNEARSPTAVALAAQAAENDYLGVPCGIMDPLAIARGATRHALFIDTLTLASDPVPLLRDAALIVVDSGVRRALNDGRYAERRAEFDCARELLGVDSLRDATVSLVESRALPSPYGERALHVVTENARVKASVSALQDNDAETLGALMNESHASQSSHLAISTPDMDALVESALRCGAIGARQTGGGFGGCLVALVRNIDLPRWEEDFLSANGGVEVIAKLGRGAELPLPMPANR